MRMKDLLVVPICTSCTHVCCFLHSNCFIPGTLIVVKRLLQILWMQVTPMTSVSFAIRFSFSFSVCSNYWNAGQFLRRKFWSLWVKWLIRRFTFKFFVVSILQMWMDVYYCEWKQFLTSWHCKSIVKYFFFYTIPFITVSGNLAVLSYSLRQ